MSRAEEHDTPWRVGDDWRRDSGERWWESAAWLFTSLPTPEGDELWQALAHELPTDGEVLLSGGAYVRRDPGGLCLVSAGEDAMDSLASLAERVEAVAQARGVPVEGWTPGLGQGPGLIH